MPLIPYSPEIIDPVEVNDITPILKDRPVGLRHFHAIDVARKDVSTGTRHFMVSVFYPGVADEDAPQARLTDILAPKIDEALQLMGADDSASASIRSFTFQAQRDLEPKADSSCPVLIYYPGGISHRLSNAAVCEQLASAGYVVFCLDAPRDAPAVVFPNGQIVPFLPNNDEDTIWPRVADVRFLLDQLESLDDFDGMLDLERIGMFGHSRGGALSNICAVEDARIKAAANIDGFLWGLWCEGTGLDHFPLEFQEKARSLTTPILRLRGDQGSEAAARVEFELESQDFGGDFISIALHGFDHSSFATTPWLCGEPAHLSQGLVPIARVELLVNILRKFFNGYLNASAMELPSGEMDICSRLNL